MFLRGESPVHIMQSLYKIAKSYVIVNDTFSDDFLALVGLPQGTVLNPLLVHIVIKLE